ncbi:MAG: DUF2066 domain-containing protein [Gammaproteobacteria bacterium]|nr:DUF2066 domain-containing protein [Gammaproteobacteria bacterium]MBP9728999.1 DUF2066 domain-containing protein [Gammaproteobacteria bacterium]
MIVQALSRKSMLFLAFLVLWGAGGAFAEALKNVYQAEVPMALDDAEVDPTKLSQEAFAALLLKIGGADILKKESIRKAMIDPDPYVKQLSYHQGLDDQRTAKVTFNESLVDRLLKEAGGAPVPKERPLTLLWLVLENSEGVHWVSVDTDPTLLRTLEQHFKQRAMPLILPLIDLLDSSQVTAEAIQAKAFDKIRLASKRYHPERIVLGSLRLQGEEWAATWTIVPQQSVVSDDTTDTSRPLPASSWESKAADHATLFNGLIDRLMKQASPQTPVKAVTPPTIRPLLLHVSAVLQAEDYAKIMQYLEKTPCVSKVRIQQIGPDSMTLSLSSTLSQDQLTQTLSKEDLLAPDPSAKPSLGEIFFTLRVPE